jgi:hypothetical protein
MRTGGNYIMLNRLFILLIGIAFVVNANGQKHLYKDVDINSVFKEFDTPVYLLLPVSIKGELNELCILSTDLRIYLKGCGVYDENIEGLIRDVYKGKRIFEGEELGELSYARIDAEYYNENFRDSDLEELLNKYVKLGSLRGYDKSASIKSEISKYEKEGRSLIKYLILNNFLIVGDGYGHGLYIYDLNKGKTKIPLNKKSEDAK